jgi:hypothetical protein
MVGWNITFKNYGIIISDIVCVQCLEQMITVLQKTVLRTWNRILFS